MNMEFYRLLPAPEEIKELYPLPLPLQGKCKENAQTLKDIFLGKCRKLLLIIGPCSADREDAIMDYMHRLKKVSGAVNDLIFIVPRLYTNKPRTSGGGYLGMLHQPDPNSKPDLLKGIVQIRKLQLKILAETGFSCADEMLYPENYCYFSDLLGYVAVGARSVENQEHRLASSGLSVPVGMKNPLSGDLKAVVNAISAGRGKHRFLYRGYEVMSKGNVLTHAILRGYEDRDGMYHENYGINHLRMLYGLLVKGGIKYPSVVIDTNHANSGKDFLKQEEIAQEILHLRNSDVQMAGFIKGLMIESYIEDGSQEESGTVYGKSITDPCLGWDKTEALIFKLYEILKNKA